MNKAYACVIFDLDGTMLDTEKMNLVPLQRLIQEDLGYAVSYENLLKYRALPGKKTLEILGFADVERAYARWVRFINAGAIRARLYDGYPEVLRTLAKRRIHLAIASAKTRRQYEIDFMPTGLHRYMKSVVLVEDTALHKPHPDPLLKAAALVGARPADCLYIGDTEHDGSAARAAGMDFALACWGALDGVEVEADYRFTEPLDIVRNL